jgi:hypothetical protein
MLRYLIAASSLFLIHFETFAAASGSLHPFKFTEVKRVKEIDGLPPKINLVFDLMCNEKFLKVIRHDETDPKTGKTNIAVGILVEENLLSSCAGVPRETEVSAGKTFSGRQFAISPIKK